MRNYFCIHLIHLETTSQITPTSTDNPLSDEIGTACANDPSNLWLDIIVAIDNTTGMGAGVNNVAKCK